MANRLSFKVLSVLMIVCTFLYSSVQLFIPKAKAAGETVNVWISTGDKSKLLQRQSDIQFGTDSGTYATTIDVDENNTYQTMDGFGAAVTGSSAYLINQKMDGTQRTQLMNDLFSTNGIGISFLRHTIGGSDFSLSSYSYDDTPLNQMDYNLTNFSIDKDKTDVIPVLKSALSINNNIKVLGTPWTAPVWI